MRALMLYEHGGPEKLTRVDVPTPSPGAGEVLVRIHAAAINPVDIKIREGLLIGPALPAVLGADLAGTVEKLGEGVTDFQIGDAVYGCVGGINGMGGTLVDYCLADARLLAPKPQSLTFREAAALPLVAITAWQGMEKLALAADETLLVHGGTGGVGHVVIQLAKALGAKVVATVGSEDGAAMARDLGADAVVNYRHEPVADYLARLTGGAGFTAVFDTAGGSNLATSFEAAAIGGRIVTINARLAVDLGPMHSKALSLHLVFMLLNLLNAQARSELGTILRQVSTMVDAGKLRPLIDPARFCLDTAPDAHRLLASGKARGKVVVDIV
ncbi:MAG: hypothetical protein RLZZ136_237 [Pseudomonadota bacterium]|jgi:NADPH2:quinone reductase